MPFIPFSKTGNAGKPMAGSKKKPSKSTAKSTSRKATSSRTMGRGR